MKVRTIFASLIALAAVFAMVSCGGGGGDSGPAPLQAPAFANLAATRWNTTDTVSAANSCEVGIGVTDSWVLHILAQSGNTISLYDERSGSSNAVNGTMSGSVVTYSGTRFSIGGCVDMSASYNVTLNAAGTGFTGTATITCNDAPACSVPVTVSGTKI